MIVSGCDTHSLTADPQGLGDAIASKNPHDPDDDNDNGVNADYDDDDEDEDVWALQEVF